MTRPRIIYFLLISTFAALSVFIHLAFIAGVIAPTIAVLIAEFTNFNSYWENKILYFVSDGSIKRLKRVKTEYGRFYITITKEKYSVLYQDKVFYLKNVGYSSYTDIESMKAWARRIVDSITYNVKEKNDLINSINSWNGYLDKQSEREEKLNQVL